MTRCCVSGCQNNLKKKRFLKVRNFSFPKNKALSKKWALVTGLPIDIDSKDARICADHFDASSIDFHLKDKRVQCYPRIRYIKHDAVPTLKLPTQQDVFIDASNGAVSIKKEDSKDNDILVVSEEGALPVKAEVEANIEEISSSDLSQRLDEICRLCVRLVKLRRLRNSSLARQFGGFRFMEHLIGYQLPKEVCEECFTEITKVAHFIKKCRDSQSILQEMEKGSNQNQSDIQPKISNPETNILNVQPKTLKEIKTDSETQQTLQEPIEIQNTTVPVKETLEEFKEPETKILDTEITRIVQEHDYAKPIPEEDKTRVCKTCGSSVTTTLRDHYKMSKICAPKNFTCQICNMSFTNSTKLTKHKAKHSNIVPIDLLQCHICSKLFKYDTSLKRHLSVHKGKRYMCEVCGIFYTSKYSLEQHANIHINRRPYVCSFCGKAFKASSSCWFHEKKHKSNDGFCMGDGTECVCDICDQRFSSMRFLKMHLRVHDENRVYRCKKCKEEFDTYQSFRQHGQTHIVEKRFPCDTCGKRFSNPTLLTNHVRSHTGERPYGCSQCGSRFRTPSQLKCHIISIHDTNRKPFKCNTCGKTFYSNYYLIIHMRVHTGERPFVCHVCDKDFIDSSSRRKHVRKEHGDDEVDNIPSSTA